MKNVDLIVLYVCCKEIVQLTHPNVLDWLRSLMFSPEILAREHAIRN